MKTKLTFDKQAILGFFANSSEKILFGVVVLCFLGFVYAAFGRERFGMTPEELLGKATKLKEDIERSEGPAPPLLMSIGERIANRIAPIAVEPYVFKTPLNSPVPDPLGPRREPALYPIESLQVASGVGRFESHGGGVGMGAEGGAGGAATQDPAGRRWVVITGLMNSQQLIQSYRDCFRDAALRLPTDETPTVIYARIERVEAQPNDENVDNLTWGETPYGFLTTYVTRYFGTSSGQDLVAESFLIKPYLTIPLPPRADNRPWGNEVAHPPEIPLMTIASGGPMTPPTTPTPENPEEKPPGPDEPEFDEPGTGPGGAPVGGPTMGGPVMGMGRPGVVFGGRGMMGGEEGEYGGGMMRGGMTMGGAVAGEPVSPYRLFRFIDFTVKPGKRYRYRVQIWFQNPNHGVEDRYLSRELREQKQTKNWKPYICSPWSQPSEPIFVLRDDRLLLASVSPTTRVDGESSATIQAIHWDEQTGTEVATDIKDIKRGMVANFPEQELAKPTGGPGGGFGEGPVAPPGRRGRRNVPPQAAPQTPPAPKVDFMTELLVLDVRGGQRLPGKNRDLTRPGEMLLLDPNGVMQVRYDVDDQPEYEKLKAGATGMPGGGRPGMIPYGGEGGMPMEF